MFIKQTVTPEVLVKLLSFIYGPENRVQETDLEEVEGFYRLFPSETMEGKKCPFLFKQIKIGDENSLVEIEVLDISYYRRPTDEEKETHPERHYLVTTRGPTAALVQRLLLVIC